MTQKSLSPFLNVFKFICTIMKAFGETVQRHLRQTLNSDIMKGKFFSGAITMNMNISEVANRYEGFIRNQMAEIDLQLHASDAEDEELVRRAAFLARHNYVKINTFSETQNTIQFVVQDAMPTLVQLNMNTDRISCNCPREIWCRHKVAAIFVLYQYIDSLSDWLDNFRRSKSTQLHLLKDERSPESWLALVERVYKANLFRQTSLTPYLLESIFQDMQRQVFRETPLEREWQSLFKLFTHMALVIHTWKHLEDVHKSYGGYIIRFIDNEKGNIREHIRTTSSKSRLFATDPFYDTLQTMVRRFTLQEKGFFGHRLMIYKNFWESMFNEKARRENELQTIRQTTQVADDVRIESIESMFYIMLKNYEELGRELSKMKEEDLLLWLDLAQFAANNNDYEALSMILRTMLPHLDAFINNHISIRYRPNFVGAFHRLCSYINLNDEEAEVLFAAAGTYGLQPYSLFLVERGRFTEWSALHHRFPSSLGYLENCGLKTVVEQKPEVLLPLYHSLAMNELGQKSRQHYKQAVQVWKKMKTAAKKSGKNEFWNQYIDQTKKQYKRLRALQEEIEKGNLKL